MIHTHAQISQIKEEIKSEIRDIVHKLNAPFIHEGKFETLAIRLRRAADQLEFIQTE